MVTPSSDSHLQSRSNIPPTDDWRTTDQDEVNRRRIRAREELPRVLNCGAQHPIFSNFEVHSASGITYCVEIRDIARRQFNCNCVDFRVNGLGTCKHVEAVLLNLEASHPKEYALGIKNGSSRIDLVPDLVQQTLRVERGVDRLPRSLRRLFDQSGLLVGGYLPEMALELWKSAHLPDLRTSQEVSAWLESRRRESEGLVLRRTYEHNVQSGLWPSQETLLPLFPYQREGMLHLACTERALLADEMGLGKTLQAVAAGALLKRLGRAERALIVTPTSLQAEWSEQITRFTRLQQQSPAGNRPERQAAYERANAPFFTITNYETMLTDALEVNARLRPDIVILDEAQRIKNWNTKTAIAVKRLQCRYAWILTGTPIENRIDDLYSLVSFLDPAVFGPLFRFNREFYEFDEQGRPRGYRNLEELRRRIRPLLLRRRKSDVETELPNRVERNFLVPLSENQRITYRAHEKIAARLVSSGRRRQLAEPQREKLIRELNIMRMICDSNFILKASDRTCPKLEELSRILRECMANPEVKVLIFSEWERMLELVAGLCQRLRIGFATHTGGISTGQRRKEIQRFREDTECRILLSTDLGGIGLNLQNASVVINCDVPWNPARLEQRVARAWRKDQTRAVTVLNLISERTIEHRILGTLARKQALSDGVLNPAADLNAISMLSGDENFQQRIVQLFPDTLSPNGEKLKDSKLDRAALIENAPTDRSQDFCRRACELLSGAMLTCEERFSSRGESSVLLIVVEREAEKYEEMLRPLTAEFFDKVRVDGLASSVRVEVVDRQTADLLRRLADAGVVNPSLRASRTLYPSADLRALQITASEQARAKSARDQHARRMKMARVLAAEEMIEEARSAVVAAILELGRALAIEHQQPEPATALGAVAPPLDTYWPGGELALIALRSFLSDESSSVQPIISLLGQPVEVGARKARDLFAGIKAKLATIPD